MILSSMTPEDQRCEIARLDHIDLTAEAAARLKFQVEYSQAALRGLMIVNGGAIIALFTFIGNAGRAPSGFDIGHIRLAFAFFAVGLAATLLASLGAFYSQVFYTEATIFQVWSRQREMLGGDADQKYLTPAKTGRFAEIGALACAVLAWLSFISGAWSALNGVLP